MITVTVLGAGQYFLTPGDVSFYNSTGAIATSGDTKIILDLGRGCLRTLTEQGISIHDIDALVLSHLHPDHVADVSAFFQAHFVEYMKFPERQKKQIQIIGPLGIKEWVKTQLKLLYEKTLPYSPMVHEQPAVVTIGEFTVRTTLLQHIIPNIGVRLEAKNKSIVYSGDTGDTPALRALAQKTDLLILECANDAGQKTPYHLTPEECGQIAAAAGAKRLLLTHYGSRARQAALTTATQSFFNDILLAASNYAYCKRICHRFGTALGQHVNEGIPRVSTRTDSV